MGGDAQLDNVTKTMNGSGSDKAAVLNRPQILARPSDCLKTLISCE